MTAEMTQQPTCREHPLATIHRQQRRGGESGSRRNGAGREGEGGKGEEWGEVSRLSILRRDAHMTMYLHETKWEELGNRGQVVGMIALQH